MARILRAIVALQAWGAAFGNRRTQATADIAEGFPFTRATAAGAIAGYGAEGALALTPSASPRRPASFKAPLDAAPGSKLSMALTEDLAFDERRVDELQDLDYGSVDYGSSMPLALSTAAQEVKEIESKVDTDGPNNFDWKNYRLVSVQRFDEGKKSAVFRGRLDQTPYRLVAVKRVRPTTEDEVNEVLAEIKYLSEFRGLPGVVTMYHASAEVDRTEVQMVMELADGNLRDLVLRRSFRQVPFTSRLKLFADIVRAVRALEERNVCHGNLTPDNILIVGDCRSPARCSAMLCDFGKARPREGAINPDYDSLRAILYLLLTLGNPDPYMPVPFRAERGEERALARAWQAWQKMSAPESKVEFPTEKVLLAVEMIARGNGVDTSPRFVPKNGW